MDEETTELLQRAAALRRSGQVEQAIAAYSELLEREPELADSWYNLGWLQRKARQFEAALQSYGEALARGVRDPQEVHLNRAVILADHLARPDEAEAELKAALALDANYVPALLNLGNLHEDRGEREESRTAYRRAFELDPANSLALSRLAGVLDPKSDDAEAVIFGLREAISRSGVMALERADLGFALGRLLDARGNFDDAFRAYQTANVASRESAGFPEYDRGAQEQFVDRLIAAFPEPVPSTRADDSPIFLCGMFRSGSTLTEQIIAGHSGVVAGGELDLIRSLVAEIPDYPEAVSAADDSTVGHWRNAYLEGLPAHEGKRVTDKRPDNFLHIGFIKTLFPNAKIVHTRRDRLDNLLSLYFLHLDPRMTYALNLADAAHWYGQYQRLMAHWQRLYPEDIFDIEYDELVLEPRPLVERLLKFLGLDWDDSVLEFDRGKSVVKTASVWQVREPIHARSSGRWRNYERQLKEALGDLSRSG